MSLSMVFGTPTYPEQAGSRDSPVIGSIFDYLFDNFCMTKHMKSVLRHMQAVPPRCHGNLVANLLGTREGLERARLRAIATNHEVLLDIPQIRGTLQRQSGLRCWRARSVTCIVLFPPCHP